MCFPSSRMRASVRFPLHSAEPTPRCFFLPAGVENQSFRNCRSNGRIAGNSSRPYSVILRNIVSKWSLNSPTTAAENTCGRTLVTRLW